MKYFDWTVVKKLSQKQNGFFNGMCMCLFQCITICMYVKQTLQWKRFLIHSNKFCFRCYPFIFIRALDIINQFFSIRQIQRDQFLWPQNRRAEWKSIRDYASETYVLFWAQSVIILIWQNRFVEYAIRFAVHLYEIPALETLIAIFWRVHASPSNAISEWNGYQLYYLFAYLIYAHV